MRGTHRTEEERYMTLEEQIAALQQRIEVLEASGGAGGGDQVAILELKFEAFVTEIRRHIGGFVLEQPEE